MGNKFCPKCENEKVVMVAGGEIGMWECIDCGFRGSIFPEKVKLEEENEKTK